MSGVVLLRAGRSTLAGRLSWLWLLASCGFADVPLRIAAKGGGEVAGWVAAAPLHWLAYPAFFLTVPALLAVAVQVRRQWLALALGAVAAVGVLVLASLPGPWADPRTLAAVLYLALGGSAVFTAAVVR